MRPRPGGTGQAPGQRVAAGHERDLFRLDGRQVEGDDLLEVDARRDGVGRGDGAAEVEFREVEHEPHLVPEERRREHAVVARVRREGEGDGEAVVAVVRQRDLGVERARAVAREVELEEPRRAGFDARAGPPAEKPVRHLRSAGDSEGEEERERESHGSGELASGQSVPSPRPGRRRSALEAARARGGVGVVL